MINLLETHLEVHRKPLGSALVYEIILAQTPKMSMLYFFVMFVLYSEAV
jgi:hypothetical protein